MPFLPRRYAYAEQMALAALRYAANMLRHGCYYMFSLFRHDTPATLFAAMLRLPDKADAVDADGAVTI